MQVCRSSANETMRVASRASGRVAANLQNQCRVAGVRRH